MTRSEVSEELIKRGYKRDEYPGIWKTPDGKELVVWFIATKREGLSFDSKTWGPAITQSKREWQEKKRLQKLKLKN